ncbi:MAG TPA: PEP/pyruvate-binding domain-containing protein [Acidimicrobiales bacterium]|nr:PEP/pyruvate-binding domain-containing protein [Acidimicrobiales bacterium]
MKTTTVWDVLDGSEMSPVRVGGKGAWLNRLVAIGQPVPPAAVLNVDAYHRAVDYAGLADRLTDLPTDVAPDRLEADAAQVDEMFAAMDLPADIVDAIDGAYRAVGDGGLVAVRSSATAEDMGGASFAGQYRTELNVNREGLERAVRLCWASLWAPGARAYRRAAGVTANELGMALIIERMVPSRQSGVVFTVDPTVADADVARIEVVDGLGEGLVSGQVTPRVFHARRRDHQVVEADAPAFVAEVATHAFAIEAAFERPQDVEWAVVDGRLSIVQARPITTIRSAEASADDGFDTPAVNGALWSPTGVAEMLPGVLSPLLWTINGPLVEDAFRSLFRSLRVSVDTRDQPLVGRFRGRAALNLTVLKEASKHTPGGSGAEVERQYVGRVVTDEVDAPAPLWARVRRLRSGFGSLRLRRESITNAQSFLEAMDLVVGLGPNHAGLSTEALVTSRHRVRDVASKGVAAEVAVSSGAQTNYQSLEKALGRVLTSEEASGAAQQLTAGAAGAELAGYAMVASFWQSHADVSDAEEIQRAVYEGPLETTADRVRDLGAPGDAFLADIEQRLHHAGSRAVYAGESWAEHPHDLWALLRGARGVSPERGPETWMAEARDEAARYTADLEARIGKARRPARIITGQVVDVHRRMVRRITADTRLFLRYREAVKGGMLRLGGEERRIVLELARRLVDVGMLDRAADVELLSDGELDAMALGRSGPDRQELSRRRAAARTAERATSLPDAFEGEPTSDSLEVDGDGELRTLTGWAASGGRVKGRARVVRRLADSRDLAPGEILVGHTTDPSWTPLFATAAGVVMEQGGPLSHAAIIAREFHLPAVLNVEGATRILSTGTPVVVDGTTGKVEILDDEEMEDQE